METVINNTNLQSIGAPEAFYCLFRSLSKNDKFAAINYIFEDEEIRHYLKVPNEITLKAFSEDRNSMPIFNSIDELREDIIEHVGKDRISEQLKRGAINKLSKGWNALAEKKRKPSPVIMGKGRIIGDIMSPVAQLEDWEALQ